MTLPVRAQAFALCLALAACSSKKEERKPEEEAPRTLPVLTLSVMDTALVRSYVADIQAVQNVEIRARVGGFLDKICVDEGKEVQKGQCLFRLNNEGLKAELSKARASLLQAEADAKTLQYQAAQVRVMVEKNVIAQSELDVAESKLAAARATVSQMRSVIADAASRLSYTNINAPFTGVVDRFPLKPGSLVNEGDLLTSLSDASAIYAYFNVSENEYLEYVRSHTDAAGHPDGKRQVQLSLADGSLYPYPGMVETLEGEFEGNTGSIAFRARFPNPQKLLKHGSTGRVLLANQVDDALLIPQKSVVEIQDKNFVYLLGPGNVVTLKSFKPRSRLDKFYVVASGLKAGDRIVYEGAQELREGARIQPQALTLRQLMEEEE